MWTLSRLSIALSQIDLFYMIRHLTNKMYCLYAQARRAPVLPWALQVVELLEPLSPGPVMLSGCNVSPWFFEPYVEWIRLGRTGLSWDPEPAKFPGDSLASRPLQMAGTALSLKDCGVWATEREPTFWFWVILSQVRKRTSLGQVWTTKIHCQHAFHSRLGSMNQHS